MKYTTNKRIANVRTFRKLNYGDSIFLRRGCPVEFKNYNRFSCWGSANFDAVEALSAYLHSAEGRVCENVRVSRTYFGWRIELMYITG